MHNQPENEEKKNSSVSSSLADFSTLVESNSSERVKEWVNTHPAHKSIRVKGVRILKNAELFTPENYIAVVTAGEYAEEVANGLEYLDDAHISISNHMRSALIVTGSEAYSMAKGIAGQIKKSRGKKEAYLDINQLISTLLYLKSIIPITKEVIASLLNNSRAENEKMLFLTRLLIDSSDQYKIPIPAPILKEIEKIKPSIDQYNHNINDFFLWLIAEKARYGELLTDEMIHSAIQQSDYRLAERSLHEDLDSSKASHLLKENRIQLTNQIECAIALFSEESNAAIYAMVLVELSHHVKISEPILTAITDILTAKNIPSSNTWITQIKNLFSSLKALEESMGFPITEESVLVAIRYLFDENMQQILSEKLTALYKDRFKEAIPLPSVLQSITLSYLFPTSSPKSKEEKKEAPRSPRRDYFNKMVDFHRASSLLKQNDIQVTNQIETAVTEFSEQNRATTYVMVLIELNHHLKISRPIITAITRIFTEKDTLPSDTSWVDQIKKLLSFLKTLEESIGLPITEQSILVAIPYLFDENMQQALSEKLNYTKTAPKR